MTDLNKYNPYPEAFTITCPVCAAPAEFRFAFRLVSDRQWANAKAEMWPTAETTKWGAGMSFSMTQLFTAGSSPPKAIGEMTTAYACAPNAWGDANTRSIGLLMPTIALNSRKVCSGHGPEPTRTHSPHSSNPRTEDRSNTPSLYS